MVILARIHLGPQWRWKLRYSSLRKYNVRILDDALEEKGFRVGCRRLDPLEESHQAFRKINLTTKSLEVNYQGNLLSVPLDYYWRHDMEFMAQSIAMEFALVFDPSLIPPYHLWMDINNFYPVSLQKIHSQSASPRLTVFKTTSKV